MEKVAQSIDYSIAVKGLSTEANGTLGRFAGLLREAPQWLTPICNPGKDWKVFEAKGMEYLTVLNALVAASEAAAAVDKQEGMGKFSRSNRLYDAMAKAAEQAGNIKAVNKAQRVLHNRAYWYMNNDAQNRTGLAKYLRTFPLSDGSVLLRAHLANDVESLAGLIAMKEIGFAGKKEHIEYAIGKVEPWLKGFGVGGCANVPYVFYVERSGQEKARWLEVHPDYINSVNAFFAELRSSCAGDGAVADSVTLPVQQQLRE